MPACSLAVEETNQIAAYCNKNLLLDICQKPAEGDFFLDDEKNQLPIATLPYMKIIRSANTARMPHRSPFNYYENDLRKNGLRIVHFLGSRLSSLTFDNFKRPKCSCGKPE